MNIFTKKLESSPENKLPVDPIKLYQTCQFKEGYGYLRGVQEEVLKQWHAIRDQRDVVFKMNTGAGKTLTGLLILYSKLIEHSLPVAYLCPDQQLLEQTLSLAKNYGIPVCTVGAHNQFPAEFLNGKSVLVTTFSRLFNGKSIFKRDGVGLGAVLLDDAHKCVDIARDQTVVRFANDHDAYEDLFNIFKADLAEQLPGTFHRIEYGDPTLVMKIPYWTWIDNQRNILQILNKHKEGEEVLFKLDLIADNLMGFDCYISANAVEINPIHVPYHEVIAFNEAKHRYILSATFEDDYDLIKDLGISFDSIINPIIPKNRQDIGKRLILAPSRFDPSLEVSEIHKLIASYPEQGVNTVVLVPSKQKSNNWVNLSATAADRTNINDTLQKLNGSNNNFIVLANRFDGIDLHNDLCRVLVIDGLPKYTSLMEQYLEPRLESLRASKKAQIIEQGLGRATRSGSDYSIVFLLGDDLLLFLGQEKNLQYFTPVTRSQLVLGLTLLDNEEKKNSLTVIKNTAQLSLSQDPAWHAYHTREILSKGDEEEEKNLSKLKIAEIERLAMAKFNKRHYEEASRIILDQLIKSVPLTEKEKGWYYQFAAQLVYPQDTVKASNLQNKAYEASSLLFHPKINYTYKLIGNKGEQAISVRQKLQDFNIAQDVSIYINQLLKDLVYSPKVPASKFEQAMDDLGNFLGFSSIMPDKDLGIGPDVLWCMTDNYYLVIEAKSEAVHIAVTKENLGQLTQAELWFKSQYPNAQYTCVTAQPPSIRTVQASVAENMRVMSGEGLAKLHVNLKGFAKALEGKIIKDLEIEEIGNLLLAYKLTPALFRENYLQKIKNP
jgi:hypothetical protein